MSATDTTDDSNRTLIALREREADIRAEAEGLELAQAVLRARLEEVAAAIEIVARDGRRKPGPKPQRPAELRDALRASLDLVPPPPDNAA